MTNGDPVPDPDGGARAPASPWAALFYLVAGAACLALIVAAVLRAVRTEAGFRDAFTRPDVIKISREEVLARQLSLREAMYYAKLAGNEAQCELCPTLCRLRDGERGQCKVRVNYAGTLYTLVYGRLVSEHVDPIEKKPLHHFLPASDVYSVATAGCNLGCVFCQNWEISQAFPEDAPFTLRPPADVVRLAEAATCPSIAYTYTEPSVFFEYMLDCARLARGRGLKNVWVTCGYLNEKPLRELAKVLDAANVDVKGFDEAFYAKWCGGQLAPVLRTLEVLKEMKVHIEVTNLLVPGGNDDPGTIRALCRWLVERIGPQVPIHFTRYHPDFQLERPGPTPLETLAQAREIALAEGLKYVYVGNVARAEGLATDCAGCGKRLIARRGFWVTSNEVKEGRCPACGARVPGVWPGAVPGSVVTVPVDEPAPTRK
jgi:pyruvate formate lyase activating enzyme